MELLFALAYGVAIVFLLVTLFCFFFVQISQCSLGRHSDLSRLVAFVLFLRCDARQPKTGYPQLLFYSFRFWIFPSHGFSWLYSRISSQPMGVLGFLCTGSVWAVLTLCLMSVISCSGTWWPSAFLGGENWNMCIFSIIQLKGFLVFTCLGWSFVLLGIAFRSGVIPHKLTL